MKIKDLNVELGKISILWSILQQLKDSIDNIEMSRYGDHMQIDKLSKSSKN